MTKEEIQQITDRILLGTATEEEIIRYNRLCDFIESTSLDVTDLSTEEKEHLGAIIKKAISQKAVAGKVYLMNWLKVTTVAASILLVIALGWIIFYDNKKEPAVARGESKSTDSINFVSHHEINTSGKEKRIPLPDASLMVLANNSEVYYREPFINTRDITLNGKAYFQVAKDQRKPFIVTSGAISTTALGTAFTVTAYQSTNYIIVRLYEGKVVIKALDHVNKKLKNDVYLRPGEEFVYNADGTGKLQGIKVKKVVPEQILKAEKIEDDPLLPNDVDAPWFMFNNQPLEKVLVDLGDLYNVRIMFNKTDVQNIYFIGKYNKSESLETILKRICTLNNLTITKSGTDFLISK